MPANLAGADIRMWLRSEVSMCVCATNRVGPAIVKGLYALQECWQLSATMQLGVLPRILQLGVLPRILQKQPPARSRWSFSTTRRRRTVQCRLQLRRSWRPAHRSVLTTTQVRQRRKQVSQ